MAIQPAGPLLLPHWHAVHVRARHEKKVASALSARIPSVFLPIYEVKRRWQRRTVIVQLPLFSGYLFAQISPGERLRVLEVPGVVRIVGNGNPASAMPTEQIEALRIGTTHRLLEPHDYLIVGQTVRVCAGPFEGTVGILVRKNNKQRMVVSVEAIARCFSVEVEASDLETLRTPIDIRATGWSFSAALNRQKFGNRPAQQQPASA